jgi:CLIP-associating protein 1/2
LCILPLPLQLAISSGTLADKHRHWQHRGSPHQPSNNPTMGEKITEEQVANLLAILRADSSIDAKVSQINNVKSGIKQNNVPEVCVLPLFEAIRTSMTSQHGAIVNAGFSTLNHLLTRLSRQEPKYVVKEAARTLPLVVEKMGDQKEKYRQLAAQCLTTFWKQAPMDVERIVKNAGLVGKNSRMKEASMNWIVQVDLTLKAAMFRTNFA